MTAVLTGELSPAEGRDRVLAGQPNTPSVPGRTIGQILRSNLLTEFNTTFDAGDLPRIITELRTRGYSFVTLEAPIG